MHNVEPISSFVCSLSPSLSLLSPSSLSLSLSLCFCFVLLNSSVKLGDLSLCFTVNWIASKLYNSVISRSHKVAIWCHFPQIISFSPSLTFSERNRCSESDDQCTCARSRATVAYHPRTSSATVTRYTLKGRNLAPEIYVHDFLSILSFLLRSAHYKFRATKQKYSLLISRKIVGILWTIFPLRGTYYAVISYRLVSL